MSKILELYEELSKDGDRFTKEVFDAEIYKTTSPQLTIIDAGAYKGEYSFYAYPFAKTIYAIEPDPEPYKIMEEKISKYELGSVIKPFNIGLSKESGSERLNSDSQGGSSVDWAKSNKDAIDITTMSLCDFIEKNKIENVDILKIDCESSENHIFSAVDFPKVASRIKMIIGEHLADSRDLLEKLGYKSETYSHGIIFKR